MIDSRTETRRYLTRHFFAGLFDFGDLSAGGARSLPGMIAGICGVLLAVGLLLARIFLNKYRALANWPDPERYLQAVVTDHAFLIALPMWLVGFLTVLVSPSLFPDETDFRVLVPLPVSRRVIFGAKLLALSRFVGVFAFASHAALLPLFMITALNRWAEYAWPWHLAAYLAASLLASSFVVLAVAAVRALILAVVPKERILPVSAAIGSLMLFALVLALPVLGRLPAGGRAFAGSSPWLYLVPPAWFAGIERWLLGDARFTGLALLGAAALLLAAAIVAGGYVVLYRHFDRVILRAAATGRAEPATDPPKLRLSRQRSRPVFRAVRQFTLITLRRSVLHQGVLIAFAAIGAAIVANSVLGLDFHPSRASGRFRLMETIAWAPLVLVFASALAARAALYVPIELRANWVFRVTDRPATRRDQLNASVWVVRTAGVLAPVALMLPLQWFVFGSGAIGSSLVTVACGLLFVEVLLLEWRRVPFTCSYIPGKGFVPQIVLTGLLAFVIFTTFGSALALLAIRAPGVAAILIGPVVTATLLLRRGRLRMWRNEPIEFEDTLPTETNALKLSGN